jgi:glucose/arabinose dehydrogenase
MRTIFLAPVGLLVCLTVPLSLHAQTALPLKESTKVTVSTVMPVHEEFTPEKTELLTVSNGFTVDVVASGLGKPRMLAADDQGRLYITRRDQGDVLLLKDTDNDGKFDDLKTIVSKFKGVHGIAIYNGYLYLVSTRQLKRAKIKSDGDIEDLQTLISDLPDGGQHGNRTLAFSPDGMMFLTVGSTCNDCNETNKENATLLRANPDGTHREIFARGLRNTIGIDWHPQTKALWGADNGSDMKGENIPPEEINKIEKGKDYGWPLVFGKQQVDETREDPMGATKEEYAKTTEPSVLELPAHSAPINFVFLEEAKNLPAEYHDDAIVTLHGSWNKEKPDGYKVVRIVFENGKPVRYEDFLSGFLSKDGKSRFGRPAGIAINTKGTIFISDDSNGIIYGVQYKGTDAAKQ